MHKSVFLALALLLVIAACSKTSNVDVQDLNADVDSVTTDLNQIDDTDTAEMDNLEAELSELENLELE